MKVTLSIDDRVLAKVRERSVRRRGKLRGLSEEVEEVLRDSSWRTTRSSRA